MFPLETQRGYFPPSIISNVHLEACFHFLPVHRYSVKVVKAAAQVLNTLWQYRDLRTIYKKVKIHGFTVVRTVEGHPPTLLRLKYHHGIFKGKNLNQSQHISVCSKLNQKKPSHEYLVASPSAGSDALIPSPKICPPL